ncbi:hypothetical protein ACU3L3_07010 [Priestia endophytica]
MKTFHEKTYGDHLGLEAAICYYMDDLCGDMNQSLKDEKGETRHEYNNYDGNWELEDGTKLNVEIYLHEHDYSHLREEGEEPIEHEWVCKAYRS